MKLTTSTTLLSLTLCMAIYGLDSEAKQNRGGKTAETETTSNQRRGGRNQAASTESTTASADTRLRAKAELVDESELGSGVETETIPEFHADYRIKKGVPELKVRVENFSVGEVFNVYLEDVLIGSVTIVLDGTKTEGALDFRRGDWPANLPAELTTGMMVRIVQGEAIIFEAPFESK
ncbi:MAG: hypothetical protein AB7F86_10330 [Bdellovibrionales bacterium]